MRDVNCTFKPATLDYTKNNALKFGLDRVDRALQLGAGGCVRKPVRFDALGTLRVELERQWLAPSR